MKGEDVSSLYIAQARQLEEQGKFKDAERSGTRVAPLHFVKTVTTVSSGFVVVVKCVPSLLGCLLCARTVC